MQILIALAGLVLSSLTLNAADSPEVKPLRLKLPTANMGLIQGKPEKFYMYVNRTKDGVASRPWSGGKYGYSRTLRDTSDGIVATKFHEGIDIAPMKRDKAGRPLDIVHAISDGLVVYTNSISGRSSYGNYVVVKHDWGYGPFFSLYAHLASVNCKVGQKVRAESPLGRLGYTGVGINLTRAHLHLELGIMVHPEFPSWHKTHYPTSQNWHGAYNGLNMIGVDIAGLLISNNKNPNLTIPSFLKNTAVYYKVTVPRKGTLPICRNYPWIKQGNHSDNSPSWEISFSSAAFPLAVKPSQKMVGGPVVTYVQKSNFSHSYRSRGILSGSGSKATLSSAGSRHVQLVSGTFPRK